MYATVAATRFLLELVTLGAVGTWGYQLGGGRPVPRTLLAFALPLVIGVTWATFGAPAADHRLDGASRVALEVALFTAGAAGLAALGHRVEAIAFLAVAVATGVLLHTFEAG